MKYKGFEKNWQSIVGAISFFFVMTLAIMTGHWLADYINPPRPDPFTGEDGRELELRVEANTMNINELHKQHILILEALNERSN